MHKHRMPDQIISRNNWSLVSYANLDEIHMKIEADDEISLNFSMAPEISSFETLTPSRYVTLTIPDPRRRRDSGDRLLRVAVLDSPLHVAGQPRVAAIPVPDGRESDWIFCTESGHRQLLLSYCPDFSRLVLVGGEPSGGPDGFRSLRDSIENRNHPLEEAVGPLLLALSPKVCFSNGIPEVPILIYEDDLISSATIDICRGNFVGEMLIENVEIESDRQESDGREFRRRLRFRRMPNLVQTQVRIVPESDFGADIEHAEFTVDSRVLVHPYLPPMVASLSLVSPFVEDRFRAGLSPKVLCLGVGGGALVSFLKCQLGFEVLGVEIDDQVLRVARQYFGLEEDGQMIRIFHGDAMEFVKKLSDQRLKGNATDTDDIVTQFDAVMVDLDSVDIRNGLMAPPEEFVERSVLLALRSVLYSSGILAVNVIPTNRLHYEALLGAFREVFCDLYEVNAGNDENLVLVATVASITNCPGNDQSSFLLKLRSVISGAYIDSIKKI